MADNNDYSPEDFVRNRTAQKNNIMAAKIVAETVRTTLGPKGMDKMLVDSLGNVVVTNDGVTILEEMHIEHPAAKMIAEVARTQENEIGDGTTTAVVLSGELLKQAETLLEKSIHPTILIKGFREAAKKCQELLNILSSTITIENKDLIKKIALTAMTGKGAESSKEKLSDLIITALDSVCEKGQLDRHSIRIEKKTGSSVEDSELIDGIVIDKEKVHPNMPQIIENAKILLVDSSLEIKDLEIDTKISITSPEQMQQFITMEENMIKDIAKKVINSGCNVVFCKKGIDDLVQTILSDNGIYAVRRVKPSDMEALSKATGAKIISKLNEIKTSDLGLAGIVEEVKINDEEMTYVRQCNNPKSVTLLLRGASEHVIDEIKRALEDAIGDISSALKCGKVVSGAGSIEMELSKELRKYSETLPGREQLAVKIFAEALEIIPVTLAENAGLDPLDVLVELKSAHEKGNIWAGINVFDGRIMNAFEEGIIEPMKIKSQAISSATEVSVMILRIDDVIASSPKHENFNDN
ncbi:TCP-1/cpn60 chaperonin family protein [Candidatus Woesearchaeota archaeon]|nr:TCP-1/cpn60 chaperonin family protein [Candidatus Woesearchaeota archaeon]